MNSAVLVFLRGCREWRNSLSTLTEGQVSAQLGSHCPAFGDRASTLFPRQHLWRGIVFLGLLSLLLAGCSIRPYQSSDINAAAFLQRSLTQENNQLRVTAAVPDAGEVEALIGLDLYKQNMQPEWLKVENRGEKPVRLAPWSIDPNYFLPIEVAYMNRKKFS